MKKEWQARPFEECIDSVSYPRKIQRKDFLESGEYPIVSQEDVFINGYWNDHGDVFRIKHPVVIFGDHTRVLKFIDFDFVVGADGVKILQPKEFLIPKFFYYHLLFSDVGSLGYSRHYRLLKELSIVLPPLSEQRRIVGILDEAFAAIAAARANTEKNLQNARALFESHLNTVFSQKGDGWVETTVDRISTNLDSRRIPITKSERTSGDYPYYGASGIVDYVSEYIFEGDALLVSEDGANLLMRSTPIAFSVSGKYWVNNHAHILKFDDMATQKTVEFYLESIRLDDYITGAAQPKLTQKALNSIPIPLPGSLPERARLVESVQSVLDHTIFLEGLYTRKLEGLTALKQSLLHAAFSGEL